MEWSFIIRFFLEFKDIKKGKDNAPEITNYYAMLIHQCKSYIFKLTHCQIGLLINCQLVHKTYPPVDI